MKKKIFIITEYEGGAIAPVTFELISCARAIAATVDSEITAVVPGRDISTIAERITAETGINAIALEDEALAAYTSEGYKAALVEILEEFPYACILTPHTPQGLDYAPGLAACLDAACITAVSGMDCRGERLIFRRTCMYGKFEARVVSNRSVTVLTVMPGAFPYEPLPSPVKGQVDVRLSLMSLKTTKAVKTIKAAPDTVNIGDAEVIVAAGRGIEKEENLELVRQLAGLFRKSVVGGSRIVCDQGWLDYQVQIGLTGKTVAPKLYIACGISGSMQHAAGIKGARFIVAINKDPQAAIFQHADIGIVEDLKTFIPAIIASIRGSD